MYTRLPWLGGAEDAAGREKTQRTANKPTTGKFPIWIRVRKRLRNAQRRSGGVEDGRSCWLMIYLTSFGECVLNVTAVVGPCSEHRAYSGGICSLTRRQTCSVEYSISALWRHTRLAAVCREMTVVKRILVWPSRNFKAWGRILTWLNLGNSVVNSSIYTLVVG